MPTKMIASVVLVATCFVLASGVPNYPEGKEAVDYCSAVYNVNSGPSNNPRGSRNPNANNLNPNPNANNPNPNANNPNPNANNPNPNPNANNPNPNPNANNPNANANNPNPNPNANNPNANANNPNPNPNANNPNAKANNPNPNPNANNPNANPNNPNPNLNANNPNPNPNANNPNNANNNNSPRAENGECYIECVLYGQGVMENGEYNLDRAREANYRRYKDQPEYADTANEVADMCYNRVTGQQYSSSCEYAQEIVECNIYYSERAGIPAPLVYPNSH